MLPLPAYNVAQHASSKQALVMYFKNLTVLRVDTNCLTPVASITSQRSTQTTPEELPGEATLFCNVAAVQRQTDPGLLVFYVLVWRAFPPNPSNLMGLLAGCLERSYDSAF